MSDDEFDTAEYESCIYNAMRRLEERDPTLTQIVTFDYYTSREMLKLAQCLLAHPNGIKHLELSMTAMGCRGATALAQYIASSTTIRNVIVTNTMIGTSGHLAIAKALRTNTSLKILYFGSCKKYDRARVNRAFVEALRLNPNRPPNSLWRCSHDISWDQMLTRVAAEMGPPSMLDQLRSCDRKPCPRRRTKPNSK